MTTIISTTVREFAAIIEQPVERVAQYVEDVVTGYIDALLWSESCHGTAPIDVCDHFGYTGDRLYDCDKSLSDALNYSESDLSGDAYTSIRADVEGFVIACWEDLHSNRFWRHGRQAGHDFLLTRNGHGAGFWDRGQGEVGQRLTEASKPWGETWAYVGDDELIHVS